jgi:ABC-type transport system involved in cytochrome bd biosynthesis fused ATPase/permease subunit
MNQISVQAVNLTSVYNKGKIGLHPCSFEIEKNSMVAILGPTGCGKSTLLKTLIGVTPSAGGKVYIAGLELKENYELLKTHIGYVPQHDHDAIHFDLTVLSEDSMQKEIDDGQKFLEDFFNRKIDGFCFPYGQHNKKIISFLKKRKYLYARTTLNIESGDCFLINPTARWNHQSIEKLIDHVNINKKNLILWGHTYELKNNSDWNKIKNLYLYLKNDPRIQIVSFKKIIEETKLKF